MDLELDKSLCFSYLEKSFLETLLDIWDRIFVADCQTVNILKEFICWPWCVQEGKINIVITC